MEELTSAAKTIVALEPEDILLDNCIKKLLSNEQFMARIVKGCVDECKNLSYEQITALLGDVEFMRIPVEPGLENAALSGELAQEDYVAGVELVKFDILSWIMAPVRLSDSKTDFVKLYINIEGQKAERPGYDISERGIFYMCREISRQCGKEFTLSKDDPVKYGGLKKVYSIWICPETPEKRAGTIETISLQKEVEKNGMVVSSSTIENRYDIMCLKIIRLSKNHTYTQSSGELIGFLTDLVNDEMSKQEKLDSLAGHGVRITKTIEEEVRQMTAYSQNIAEKNMAKGISQGILKGRVEGQNLLAEAVQKLRNGVTKEELARQGYDEHTILLAIGIK